MKFKLLVLALVTTSNIQSETLSESIASLVYHKERGLKLSELTRNAIAEALERGGPELRKEVLVALAKLHSNSTVSSSYSEYIKNRPGEIVCTMATTATLITCLYLILSSHDTRRPLQTNDE